jgi:glycosyltransferase involved in cell wall biosynthesis
MKNKTRILFVSGTYFPEGCGIGDYTYHLANQLAGHKMTVGALTSSYIGVKASKKPVIVMPEISDWDLSGLKTIIKKILAFNPAIVHIQYPTAEYKKHLSTNFLPGELKKAAPNIKIVETFHEPIRDLGPLGRLRMLINFVSADGRIFVEKENYNRLPLSYKFLEDKKQNAIIGVAPNIPRSNKNISAKLRKKYKVPKNKRLMVTFGYINRVKGFDILLDIFNPEKEEWLHIGKIDNTYPNQVEWMKLAEKSGKSGYIHFTGRLDEKEVAATLASADVCVFPFRGGVTARHATYLSAVLQGSYVVATHASRSGYFAPQNTYFTAVNKEQLRHALDFNPPEKKIRPKILSWNEIAEKHVDFYRNV